MVAKARRAQIRSMARPGGQAGGQSEGRRDYSESPSALGNDATSTGEPSLSAYRENSRKMVKSRDVVSQCVILALT